MNVAIWTKAGEQTPEIYQNVENISIVANEKGEVKNVLLSQKISTSKETIVKLNYSDINAIEVTSFPIEVTK